MNLSRQLDILADILPTSHICPAYGSAETALYRDFPHSSSCDRSSTRVAHLNGSSSPLFNLKGAVMDMMWLFATVMGALLLGGIIVYKKSA
jgi:hypothetical protein